MTYPMFLERDYGFGVEFHSRGEFMQALRLNQSKLTAEQFSELWSYAREFERRNGLAGDMSRFSSSIEDIRIGEL